MVKKTLILAGLSAGILVGAIFASRPAPESVIPAVSLPAVSLSASAQIAVSPPKPLYAFEADAPPQRLIIPAIGVDAPVEGVGLTPEGAMEVVRSFKKVGWYKYGPYPGAPGNAVIEGHLDAEDSPIAVFSKLRHLQPGDAVTVIDKTGRAIEFTVVRQTLLPYTATSTAEVFGPAEGSFLNLITCGGNWIQGERTYDERLVVFAKRVR